MKKRNNKVIVLALAGIIFIALLVVFILNYSKDDSSFSILEKKWINDNTSNVIDVSIYNDVPIYGKNGNGVSFDLLDEFTSKYGVNFNKVSYLNQDTSNLKSSAFHILDSNASVSDKDILLYQDNYVLLSNKDNSIDSISDIDNMNIFILSSDLGVISNYLSLSKNITFSPKNDIDDIISSFDDDNVYYAIIPYNMYISHSQD